MVKHMSTATAITSSARRKRRRGALVSTKRHCTSSGSGARLPWTTCRPPARVAKKTPSAHSARRAHAQHQSASQQPSSPHCWYQRMFHAARRSKYACIACADASESKVAKTARTPRRRPKFLARSPSGPRKRGGADARGGGGCALRPAAAPAPAPRRPPPSPPRPARARRVLGAQDALVHALDVGRHVLDLREQLERARRGVRAPGGARAHPWRAAPQRAPRAAARRRACGRARAEHRALALLGAVERAAARAQLDEVGGARVCTTSSAILAPPRRAAPVARAAPAVRRAARRARRARRAGAPPAAGSACSSAACSSAARIAVGASGGASAPAPGGGSPRTSSECRRRS